MFSNARQQDPIMKKFTFFLGELTGLRVEILCNSGKQQVVGDSEVSSAYGGSDGPNDSNSDTGVVLSWFDKGEESISVISPKERKAYQ